MGWFPCYGPTWADNSSEQVVVGESQTSQTKICAHSVDDVSVCGSWEPLKSRSGASLASVSFAVDVNKAVQIQPHITSPTSPSI